MFPDSGHEAVESGCRLVDRVELNLCSAVLGFPSFLPLSPSHRLAVGWMRMRDGGGSRGPKRRRAEPPPLRRQTLAGRSDLEFLLSYVPVVEQNNLFPSARGELQLGLRIDEAIVVSLRGGYLRFLRPWSFSPKACCICLDLLHFLVPSPFWGWSMRMDEVGADGRRRPAFPLSRCPQQSDVPAR